MRVQFLRFLIAGGANTVATYAIYFALLHFINPYWSYITAFAFGIFLSYFLNLKFTFRAAHSAVKAVSYPLVYAVQFLMGISAFHLCLKAGAPEEVAPVFAIAASVPVTFFMSRWAIGGGAKSRNPVLLLSIAAFAVSVAAVYGSLLAGDLFQRGMMFNSDFSTPYLMWKDIFFDGGRLSEWNFERVSAPHILIDLPIIWAIYTVVGGSLAAGTNLFGILMLLLSAAGWMLLSDFFFGKKPERRALVFALFAMTCASLAYGSSDLFGVAFFPISHFSTWVFMPFCVLIFLSALRSESPAAVAGFSVLLAAACSALTYSDPVFTAWFTAPVFASGVLSLLLSRRRGFILPLAALPVGFVCARFFGKLFLEPGSVTVQYKGLGTFGAVERSMENILTWAADASVRHPTLAFVWVAFFVILLRGIFKTFPTNFENRGKSSVESWFFRLFLFFSSVSSVAACVLSGNFTDFAGMLPGYALIDRYFLPAVFIPFFAGWAFIPNLTAVFSGRYFPFSFSASVAAVSTFLLAVSVPRAFELKENASKFVNYYPELARCFDENASKFGLKKGIAAYWWAKSIMATSKAGVKMAHVSISPDSNRTGRVLYKWGFGISDRFYEGPFDFIVTNKSKLRPDQDICLGEGGGGCAHFSSKTDLWITYILRPEHAVYHFKREPSRAFSCGGARILVYDPPL